MPPAPLGAAFLPLLLLLPLPAGGAEEAAGGPCGLRSLAVRARDLGLGYASEETLLFKYCGGGCPPARSNHALALARLRPPRAAPPAPCCRPARYEDVAFLDDGHRWRQVGQLSAAACRCVG